MIFDEKNFCVRHGKGAFKQFFKVFSIKCLMEKLALLILQKKAKKQKTIALAKRLV